MRITRCEPNYILWTLSYFVVIKENYEPVKAFDEEMSRIEKETWIIPETSLFVYLFGFMAYQPLQVN